MLNRVILAENSIDPSTWEAFDVDDLCAFLKERYGVFPDTARIYHNQVAESCDVTPSDTAGIERLKSLEGTFYVIVYPGDPASIVYWVVTIVVAIVAYNYASSLGSGPPTPAVRNTQTESPNNELSNRQNRARPNGRIPDVYGTVRSTPDLLSAPYKVFENHQEVEFSYMCIGRGYYDINQNDVKDDTTRILDIAGTSVEVFEPNTSPNSGDAPQLRIGTVIGEPLYSTVRSNSVNGQVLRAPNSGTVIGDNDIKFVSPDEIHLLSSDLDFSDYFQAGDALTITNALYDDTVTFVNLDGTYAILSVSSSIIVLSNPATVNTDWNLLTSFAGNETGYISPTLETSGSKWIGPFTFDIDDLSRVFSNFVALNGLYKDNGTNQTRFDVIVELELTPVNGSGSPSGPSEFFQGTVEGSATTRSSRALTINADPSFIGSCQIRARRVTDADLTFNGSVVDEIKWRDVYGVSPVSETDFGNVTTVHSVTYATAGALAIKSRKLNMLVTRKIPQRVSGSTFTTELFPTNRVDEIFSAVCLDPYIGNRDVSEIDFDNIYDTVAEVEAYFGLEKAVEFNYTFDNENLSFEESASSIATSIFCKAYRRGNVIKLSFEKETEDSTLLFNHRNKLPGTEQRTLRFGNLDNHDGVELEYVDSDDDALVTYYIPADRSAINSKKIETLGIRNKIQAYFHSWRAWNKIQHQNIASEFEATQEADLLILNDRVLVADNTRPGTQDGDVISQNGLELTLSQAYVFDGVQTYTIFLQHADGSVESIGVTAGSTDRIVVLANAPKAPLSLDIEAFARATYQIVGSASTREQAFLVAEKEPQNNFTSVVRTINYSDEYYENDEDYIDGIVDEYGNAVQSSVWNFEGGGFAANVDRDSEPLGLAAWLCVAGSLARCERVSFSASSPSAVAFLDQCGTPAADLSELLGWPASDTFDGLDEISACNSYSLSSVAGLIKWAISSGTPVIGSGVLTMNYSAGGSALILDSNMPSQAGDFDEISVKVTIDSLSGVFTQPKIVYFVINSSSGSDFIQFSASDAWRVEAIINGASQGQIAAASGQHTLKFSRTGGVLTVRYDSTILYSGAHADAANDVYLLAGGVPATPSFTTIFDDFVAIDSNGNDIYIDPVGDSC